MWRARHLVLLLAVSSVSGVPPRRQCGLNTMFPAWSPEGRSVEGDELRVLAEFAVFLHQKVPALLQEFAVNKAGRSFRQQRALQLEEEELAEIQNLIETVDRLSLLDYFRPTTTSTSTTTIPTTTTTTTERSIKDHIEDLVQNVVGSMKNMIQTIQSSQMSSESVKAVFQAILAGIKEALDEAGIVIPISASPTSDPEPSVLSHWPVLCKAVWFPYHADNCRSARCTACSPVLLASSRVCGTGRTGSDGLGRVGTGRTGLTSDCMEAVMGPGVCSLCTEEFLTNL